MRLITLNGEFQCPCCLKFFETADGHDNCKKDKRPAMTKKSLITVDADPDAYGHSAANFGF